MDINDVVEIESLVDILPCFEMRFVAPVADGSGRVWVKYAGSDDEFMFGPGVFASYRILFSRLSRMRLDVGYERGLQDAIVVGDTDDQGGAIPHWCPRKNEVTAEDAVEYFGEMALLAKMDINTILRYDR